MFFLSMPIDFYFEAYPAVAAATAESAQTFATSHIPQGQRFKIVANLGEAQKAAQDPALRYLIISDGKHHALFQKDGNGDTNAGLSGWSAYFAKAGYVPAAAFYSGSGEISAAVNKAMISAKKAGLGVKLGVNQTYTSESQIKVLQGVKYLHGNGSTIQVGAGVRESAVKFETGLQNSTIDGLVLNMNNRPLSGILAQGTQHTTISNNTVYNTGANDKAAISITGVSNPNNRLSTNNVSVLNNRIIMPDGKMERGSGGTAIYVGGYPIAPKSKTQAEKRLYEAAAKDVPAGQDLGRWSLYAKGNGKVAETNPEAKAANITIQGNYIDGGRYGIGFNEVSGNSTISHNYLTNNTRNISLQNNVFNVAIKNNLLTDALSAGVLLGYNADHNTISGNIINSTRFVGQALIIAVQGSNHNTITRNHLDAAKPSGRHEPGKWLIYAGSDTSDNNITDNIISGSAKGSALGLEAIWDRASASGERAAYTTGLPIHYNGGNGSTKNVSISGNIIAPSFPAAPVLYVGADTSKGWNKKSSDGSFDFPARNIIGHITGLSLKNNIVLGTQGTHFSELIRKHENGGATVNGGKKLEGLQVGANGITRRNQTVYAIHNHSLNGKDNTLVLIGNQAINGSGGPQDDIITGNAQANVLNGGAGNDTLDGGYGHDVLNGGAGADTFVFSSKLSDTENINILKDFNPNEGDKISLHPALTGNNPPAAWFAKAGAETPATRVIQKGNTLYYDADGSGSAFQPVKFAVLPNNVQLNAGHFK
ncbi:NosD domain-containing protein [Neisseria sp. 83E34]|uniref:calcium-binding protein n=1 Tax=Neisseria sp. 83E34 TaxID=1692264 RepID=UPI0006CEA948|nr:NosD domain-containing protein [Neisseria sp. 83E34]KPN72101.1 hypothetical protein AKG09_02720 [Neisseria sp. 83E34]